MMAGLPTPGMVATPGNKNATPLRDSLQWNVTSLIHQIWRLSKASPADVGHLTKGVNLHVKISEKSKTNKKPVAAVQKPIISFFLYRHRTDLLAALIRIVIQHAGKIQNPKIVFACSGKTNKSFQTRACYSKSTACPIHYWQSMKAQKDCCNCLTLAWSQAEIISNLQWRLVRDPVHTLPNREKERVPFPVWNVACCDPFSNSFFGRAICIPVHPKNDVLLETMAEGEANSYRGMNCCKRMHPPTVDETPWAHRNHEPCSIPGMVATPGDNNATSDHPTSICTASDEDASSKEAVSFRMYQPCSNLTSEDQQKNRYTRCENMNLLHAGHLTPGIAATPGHNNAAGLPKGKSLRMCKLISLATSLLYSSPVEASGPDVIATCVRCVDWLHQACSNRYCFHLEWANILCNYEVALTFSGFNGKNNCSDKGINYPMYCAQARPKFFQKATLASRTRGLISLHTIMFNLGPLNCPVATIPCWGFLPFNHFTLMQISCDLARKTHVENNPEIVACKGGRWLLRLAMSGRTPSAKNCLVALWKGQTSGGARVSNISPDVQTLENHCHSTCMINFGNMQKKMRLAPTHPRSANISTFLCNHKPKNQSYHVMFDHQLLSFIHNKCLFTFFTAKVQNKVNPALTCQVGNIYNVHFRFDYKSFCTFFSTKMNPCGSEHSLLCSPAVNNYLCEQFRTFFLATPAITDLGGHHCRMCISPRDQGKIRRPKCLHFCEWAISCHSHSEIGEPEALPSTFFKSPSSIGGKCEFEQDPCFLKDHCLYHESRPCGLQTVAFENGTVIVQLLFRRWCSFPKSTQSDALPWLLGIVLMCTLCFRWDTPEKHRFLRPGKKIGRRRFSHKPRKQRKHKRPLLREKSRKLYTFAICIAACAIICVSWILTFRFGEAIHPGPDELAIITCNPTTIWNKQDQILKLCPAIVGISETAATQQVQTQLSKWYRERRLQVEWSSPVGTQGGSMAGFRGLAGGTSIVSPFPHRSALADLPQDILYSSRFCESHILIAPHRYLYMASIYGPTAAYKFADPVALMDRIFNCAAERAMIFKGPAAIVGDFNTPLNCIASWQQLRRKGWIDTAEISAQLNAHDLEPTSCDSTSLFHISEC